MHLNNDKNETDGLSEKEDPRKKRVRDCIRGSLMAGAAGDALGYPVKFMSRKSILSQYGGDGITQFELDRSGKALVSGNTQMTLIVANAILMGETRGSMRGMPVKPEYYVNAAFSQRCCLGHNIWNDLSVYPEIRYTWICDLPDLNHCRDPRVKCNDRYLDERKPKLCWSIMCVTPMGLREASFETNEGRYYYPTSYLARAGATIAEYSQLRHPLGYLPAALLTLLIARIVPLSLEEVKASIVEIVNDGLEVMMGMEANEHLTDKEYLKKLTMTAIELARSSTPDEEAIRQLGEGWSAEEAWAISLYCSIRHIDSMKEAIIAAVNHDGDSDSTGCITGNIMGAIYGYETIEKEHLFCPDGREFEETIELSNIILALADDLFTGCIISERTPINSPEKKQWHARYCKMKPVGI